MKLVILAGGYGKRLTTGDNTIPKPLVEIGEKPLIWYVMKLFASQGITEFIICLGYMAEEISDTINRFSEVSDGSWDVINVDTGIESSKLSRIKQVSGYLAEETNLLSYADNLCDLNLSALLKQHNKEKKLLTITGVRPHSPYGHIFMDNGMVSFKEKPEMKNSLVNAGFMAFNRSFLGFIDKHSGELETEIISALARENELGVYRHTGRWIGINNSKEYETVYNLHKNGDAFWEIWKK